MNINSLVMPRVLSGSETGRSRQATGGSSFAETLEAKAGQSIPGKADSRVAAVMGTGTVQPLEQNLMPQEPSSVLSQEEKSFFELYTARKYLSESEMQFFSNAALGGKTALRGDGYGRAFPQPLGGGVSLQA